MRLVQESMAVWMDTVGEKQAVHLWRIHHMGEIRNVSNASAGYVGTNMALGIESWWIYMTHNMVGSAGLNMGMSPEVFEPSLVKYIKVSKT